MPETFPAPNQWVPVVVYDRAVLTTQEISELLGLEPRADAKWPLFDLGLLHVPVVAWAVAEGVQFFVYAQPDAGYIVVGLHAGPKVERFPVYRFLGRGDDATAWKDAMDFVRDWTTPMEDAD